MKRKFILLSTLIAICSVPLTTIVACKPDDPTTKPEQIFVDKSNFQFFEQTDTVKITPYVYPYDSANEFVWESSDPENFPVNQDGEVTWSGHGYYAYIYVHPKGYDDLIASCRVNACFDFENCDWSVMVRQINALENGEIDAEKFCNSFYFVEPGQPSVKKIPKNINEFVGRTKKLNVNRISHEVIILGAWQDHRKYMGLDAEGHDIFTEPVVFTFQFNNVICATDKTPLTFQWNPVQDSGDYWQEKQTGQIHDSLNDPTNGVLSMIDDPVVRDNIKTVKRRVNVCDDIHQQRPVWTAVMGDEKVFLPTVFDIFDYRLESLSVPYWENYYNESVRVIKHADIFVTEYTPEPYTYYKDNINLEYGRINPQECLIKKDLWNNPCEYWLSSPYGIEANDLEDEYRDLVNVVFKDGHSKYILQEQEQKLLHTDQWYSVAPCFCI